ncbi:MAG: hypothetical protein K8F92_16280 [Hyphomicrobium sp.]|uniref:hypothetical protein n=1 Tax=Hyphomicrobium sp. TaxID=82 RepID=UPI00132592BE|nr:hypothetical protein [Hyphomicrobium sp.]KAB2939370.1 MAG: hypothetical protein F9K20_17290 [Hyphomicrobium sp.]MBZ0211190.1 hypothetical protein [Hyphomicrobium sp.]
MRPSPCIVLAALLLAPPAMACTGPSVQIAGDFQAGDKGWGEADGQFQLKGTEAIFTPQVGTQTARWNAGAALTNLDACATIAMPENTADASRSYAGMLFWVVDKDNFYEAVVSPNGMFTVARKVQGRILPTPPVNWLQTSALKLAPNEKNTLRVTLEGQSVAVRINDTEVARFRGQAPDGPSHVGLVASSAPAAVDTWRISEFKVTDVAPSAPLPAASPPVAPPSDVTGAIDTATPVCGTGKLLFDDAFTEHDANWGMKDSQFAVTGGEAVFSPTPGTPALRWNRVFVFGDIDACASIHLANVTTDPTASYAGLVFWVQDSRNYYQAVMAPNGYFTVARIVDGKAVAKRPVEWTKIAAIKTGAKEKNTLRVTTKGADVQIAINGKPAASFTGEQPRWPSYLGMLAASAASKKGDTWSISDLKVTAPQ